MKMLRTTLAHITCLHLSTSQTPCEEVKAVARTLSTSSSLNRQVLKQRQRALHRCLYFDFQHYFIPHDCSEHQTDDALSSSVPMDGAMGTKELRKWFWREIVCLGYNTVSGAPLRDAKKILL